MESWDSLHLGAISEKDFPVLETMAQYHGFNEYEYPWLIWLISWFNIWQYHGLIWLIPWLNIVTNGKYMVNING